MAFLTNATRKIVIDHVVATLGRAPTTAELADVTALLNGGASLADVAGYLTKSTAYLSKYPVGQTASEVAADILDAAIVGGVLAADVRLAAIDLIAGGLTAGTYTVASATNAVVAYLSDSKNNEDATKATSPRPSRTAQRLLRNSLRHLHWQALRLQQLTSQLPLKA